MCRLFRSGRGKPPGIPGESLDLCAGARRAGAAPGPALPDAFSGPDDRVAGFTLLETLVSLFVVTLIFLVIADLVTYGLYVHQAAEDVTQASALASEKVEELRARDYAALTPGGSVEEDIAGFSDNPDVDGDGTGDYIRRWQVSDQGDYKEIRVRAIASLEMIGTPKDSLMVALVAQR